MKLRNKKTGEIGKVYLTDNGIEVAIREAMWSKVYNSLDELNDEWEDYEEPKEKYNYYYLDCDGGIYCYCDTLEKTKGYREIGNYFETEEDAEKAVEKLKAWKRLKEKGHKFGGIYCDYILSKNKPVLLIEINGDTDEQDKADLKLLFGGEE